MLSLFKFHFSSKRHLRRYEKILQGITKTVSYLEISYIRTVNNLTTGKVEQVVTRHVPTIEFTG